MQWAFPNASHKVPANADQPHSVIRNVHTRRFIGVAYGTYKTPDPRFLLHAFRLTEANRPPVCERLSDVNTFSTWLHYK